MNRLTRRTETGGIKYTSSKVYEEDIVERLAYYEELEAEGKLVYFPNRAYFVKDGKVLNGWVQEVIHHICRKPLYDIRYDDNSLASYRGYLGLTVFLTEEEAIEQIVEETI